MNTKDESESRGVNEAFWNNFIAKVESLDWNFIREAKTPEFEISGWLEDSIGNEIYLVKVKNSQDVRLSVFINVDSNQIDRDLLIKIVNVCWLDGLSCKIDKVEGRDIFSILIGTIIPIKNLSKKFLWQAINILLFSEFAIRKFLPLKSVKETLDISSRLNSIFYKRVNTQQKKIPTDVEFEPVFQTLHFLMSQPVAYNDVIAICSRLQEHRECCWLIPRNSEILDDFTSFAKNISPHNNTKMLKKQINEINIENQLVRIIGDWDKDWQFFKIDFDEKKHSENIFSLYKVECNTKVNWFIQNKLACNSLWLMNDDLLKEFTELSEKICAYT